MNLKDYARSKSTNIKKLAEQIGVTPSTLYAISNGSTNFDNIGISLFNKIADALNVSTDELYKTLRFGNEETSEDEFALSSEELQLLYLYRMIDDDFKQPIAHILETLTNPNIRNDDMTITLFTE